MAKELKVTYRNSREIQLLYNVYLAHYNPLPKDVKILTGCMNQPEMDSSGSSNPEGKLRDLPSGSRPVLLLSCKMNLSYITHIR